MVKNTGQPGYLQIADDLRTQIRGGALAPGQALPSTAQLAQQYDASLSVVKMAVGILRNEGLVIGQQGRGVFVRDLEPGSEADEPDLRVVVRELAERVARIEA